MSKIDIAMATYNGEKYLREQIISIQNQTYTDWTLFISDDLSNDNTLAIIKEFSLKDERIRLVNSEKQGGVIANFNKALLATNAELVALSDQDDVWPENRLEILVKTITAEKDSHKPLLIYSDLTLVNKERVEISQSLYKARGLDPKENMSCMNLLWKSSVYGCSTIMNRPLLNKSLPLPHDITMHDNWLALNAVTEDGLRYLNLSTILYRQHDNNVVGGTNKSFWNKIKLLDKTFKKIVAYNIKSKKMILIAKEIEGNEVLKNVSFKFPNNLVFAYKYILPELMKKGRMGYTLLSLIAFMVNK